MSEPQGPAESRRSRLSRRDFMAGALAGAALPLIGAAAPAQAATPVKGGHLIVGIGGGGATDSLDPTTFATLMQRQLACQFGNQLMNIAPSGEIEAELAESWEMSDDANHWIFKLRSGVEFTNGKPLTAADVVHSINRHRLPGSKSGAKGQMEEIADIKASGPLEVTVALKDRNVDFHWLFTDYHLIIQPADAAPESGIGTGPYVIEQADPGVRYQLRRNPNYWRSDRAHIETVELRLVNDSTARLAGLQSGALDMINQLDPRVVDQVKAMPGLLASDTPGRFYDEFNMHCDTPPFDNADLRLALKYAIDRQALIDKILHGHGRLGNDHPISPSLPLFPESIAQRSYDPDKARFLFRKSGYDGPIQLHTATTAFAGAVDAAELYAQNAKKAGIELDIKVESPDGYSASIWAVAPFCATTAACRPTIDLSLSKNYLSTAVWNTTHWRRPNFDKLLLAGRGETDQAKRKEIYTEAITMLHDDGGVVLPAFPNYLDGWNSKVKGFVGHPAGEFCNFHATELCWIES